ncbi:MAG: hypothetical protein ABJC88_16775 [Parasphingorhabdus sp.]|uniref:hypothetical protein n=1 Tax=Parasphingorhabdus sp. TaxID=2709688 RepID=UPI0032651C45
MKSKKITFVGGVMDNASLIIAPGVKQIRYPCAVESKVVENELIYTTHTYLIKGNKAILQD